MIQFSNAPLQRVALDGFVFYLKRDDLLHSELNGNKARKLAYFVDFEEDFERYICYGGAQSNMLQSLSYLSHTQKRELVYYTKQVPKHIKENPTGNYEYALKHNAKIVELGDKYDSFIFTIEPCENERLILQGGLQASSEYGLKKLADEILQNVHENSIQSPKLFLPSGTGTTALYLQKHLPFKVYTLPTVGDADYLREQISTLEEDSSLHPTILTPPKKYHFANLYQEFFSIYNQALKECGVEFDLLYDSVGLITMLANKEELGSDVIYLHQGGLLGNLSMIARYLRREF